MAVLKVQCVVVFINYRVYYVRRGHFPRCHFYNMLQPYMVIIRKVVLCTCFILQIFFVPEGCINFEAYILYAVVLYYYRSCCVSLLVTFVKEWQSITPTVYKHDMKLHLQNSSGRLLTSITRCWYSWTVLLKAHWELPRTILGHLVLQAHLQFYKLKTLIMSLLLNILCMPKGYSVYKTGFKSLVSFLQIICASSDNRFSVCTLNCS